MVSVSWLDSEEYTLLFAWYLIPPSVLILFSKIQLKIYLWSKSPLCLCRPQAKLVILCSLCSYICNIYQRGVWECVSLDLPQAAGSCALGARRNALWTNKRNLLFGYSFTIILQCIFTVPAGWGKNSVKFHKARQRWVD